MTYLSARNIHLLPLSPALPTATLLDSFPPGNIVACDFAVEGAAQITGASCGYRQMGLCNIDHAVAQTRGVKAPDAKWRFLASGWGVLRTVSRANFLVLPLIAVFSGCATNPSGNNAPSAPAAPAPIVVIVTATPAPTMVAVVAPPTPTPEPPPEPLTPTAVPVVMDTRSPEKIQEAIINKLGRQILNATSQNEVQGVKNMVVMARQDAEACKPDWIDPRTWSQIARNGLFQNALLQLEHAADYKLGALNGEPYRETLATSAVNTAAAIVSTEAERPESRANMVANVVEQTRIITGRNR